MGPLASSAAGAGVSKGPAFWVNVGLLAAAAGCALAAALAGAGGADEPVTTFFIVAAGALLLVLSISAPVARWGAGGLFLSPGLLLVVAGIAVLVVGRVAEEAREELAKDNDGDGRFDEDPPGDADNSARDPTQVSGVSEAGNPSDDDSDGRTDEDPPEPLGSATATESLRAVGQALLWLGLGAIGLFVLLAWMRTRERRQQQQQTVVVVQSEPKQP